MVSNANENTLVLSDPRNARSTLSVTLPGRGPLARVKGAFTKGQVRSSAERLNELRRTGEPVVVTLECKGNGTPVARASATRTRTESAGPFLSEGASETGCCGPATDAFSARPYRASLGDRVPSARAARTPHRPPHRADRSMQGKSRQETCTWGDTGWAATRHTALLGPDHQDAPNRADGRTHAKPQRVRPLGRRTVRVRDPRNGDAARSRVTRRRVTVDQVVHDYGDLCQAIMDLASERVCG